MKDKIELTEEKDDEITSFKETASSLETQNRKSLSPTENQKKLQKQLDDQNKTIKRQSDKIEKLLNEIKLSREECVICQETLMANRYFTNQSLKVISNSKGKGKKDKDLVSKKLICDHTQFHQGCLKKWLNKEPRCPLCN